MSDINKERIARTGEVVQLRDPSDHATYTHTVGLIKDFSDSRTKFVDADIDDKGDAQVEVVEVEDNLPSNISNLEGLTLHDFVSKLREKRARQLTNQPPKKAA